ncbi:nicotinate-nucleotide--dimethylbenzimidazole phosphoribosyltransferase [Streptomyces sp. NBC_00252]|uniref:nicotinate-nucleotide--dimethylbenzimidazole phosphoribosyltransferase n=1 Tax=Streptomyces sp. NBC_00252 TaxID=2975691 RepID=UPI002E2C549A|nr:nicotinate-nucleotide--dimethylbenzimidazole phosphoribosyltransferase [Streptomyces sp. NBC_00252]
MTDTGQIPAEGLPENAGMVEQPGVPAHGAYTYLSETTAEDEDLLLLPGAQGAWGNEVPPPAPEPVVETVHAPAPQEQMAPEQVAYEGVAYEAAAQEPVPQEAPVPEAAVPEPGAHEVPVHEPAPQEAVVHEPGPHETDGRDSGSVDLGAVRHPAPPPPAPVPPRRPLHLGPPLPDTSASPVRSLADRGPAGAPVRQPGPVATGPEYFDAPQLRDLPPQGASPWGVQPPVSAGAQTAETVVPVAEPDSEPTEQPAQLQTPVAGGGGIATALDAGVVAPEPGPAAAVAASAGTGAGLAQAPEAGTAWQVQDQVFAGEPATPFAHVSTETSGNAGVHETGQLPEGVQASLAGQPPEQPVQAQVYEQGAEPQFVPDAGVAAEGAVTPVAEDVAVSGAGPVPEDAPVVDAGPVPESVPVVAAAQEPEPEQAPSDAVPVAEEPFVSEAAVTPEQAPPVEQVFAAEQAPPVEQVFGAEQAPVVEQAHDTPPVHEVTPAEGTADFQEAAPTQAAPAEVEPPFTPEPAAFAEAAPVPAELPEAEAVVETEPVPVAPPVVAEAPAPEPAAEAAPLPEPEQLVEPEPELVLPSEPQAQPVAPEGVDFVQPQPVDADAQSAGGLPPHPDDSLGRFVPVEGSVPTTPHLAPTPPHPLTLPPEEQLVGAEDAFAAVPAPREADADLGPELVQHADDLDTRAADQEEESTAVVEDVRESTGPAAPAYDDAEREAVLKVMRERRDIRNGFRSDPIPHDVLLRVLEAAHTAPSVGHSQPWDFVVIRSAETRRNMHELAQSQREAYAKSLPKGRAKQFKELKIEAILDTPVNIVVTADPTRGGRHTLGRHTQPQMAPYSAALAVENLWLAARAEGLGVGWVSFFDEREMVRALGLPEHLEVIAYLCVGYVDEFPDEPELMQAGWSKRRPLSWVVHEETYGRRALPGEDPHDLLAETVAGIRPLDAKALGEAWERQKRMTKPPGSLGMLEIISAQLSGLSRQCPPPIPEPAAVAIFAGDHGVHAQGVTPWPQEVTAQMVANFLGGGAVCNAFASQVGAEVCVVDVGVASELPATPGLLPRKIRAGTSDMTTGPAMSREEAKQAIEVGIETARDLVAAGNKALLTGEMGIANTTASAALISVFTDTDPAEVTGRGTGINDETLARKTEVVRRAIDLHQPDPADPIGVLAAVGGFEHAAMVGLLLGGASLRTPVILDGVSAGAAALVARAIAPEVLAACIAGHRSAEPGHVAALNKLGLRPLVDLDLRLGEGTGALLALPLVQSTARAMHEVATFDSAGVTEK